MIKVYTQTTHSKFSYDDSKEDQEVRKLLIKSFVANNTALENDPRVKRGYMSSLENFYNEDNDILPTGLIPYVFEIFKNKNIEYEHIELRSFPSVNKQLIKDLMDDKVVFNGMDSIERRPREYQKESVLRVIKTKGGIISLPTSSGKTLISALIPMIYRKHKVLFIFDSIDLINQTYKNFIEDFEMNPDEISVIQGSNYKYDAKKSRIILLSMMSYEKAFHIFPQVKVIISDECHSTSRTETAQKIIYSCQNASIRIGLSATPDRIKNPAEQLRLYSITGPIVYEKKIIEQIDNKHISDLTVNLYEIKLPNDNMLEVKGSYNDIYEKSKITRAIIKAHVKQLYSTLTLKVIDDMIRKYYDEDKRVDEIDHAINYIIDEWKKQDDRNEIVKEEGDYYFRRFVEYGDESTHYIYNTIRNNKIAEIAKNNKRVLILFNKINHGLELKKLIPDAVLIHGKDKTEIRDEAEKYLRENENSIVLSSKIWAKGKNIPEIENYINAGGGVSEIEQIQKMGRAVRLSAKTGKEMAYVHDFYDAYSPLSIKQSNIRKRVYKKEGLKINYY